VNPACKDLEVLLSLRAAGALEPAEAARVEAHLAACPACRAEAAADADVLRLATLPPTSEADRRATATLAKDALAAFRRREAFVASWKRAAAGFAAAAALALVVVAPAVLGKKQLPPQISSAAGAAATAESWEAPDLDTLWSDADVLDVSGASYASASAYGSSYATGGTYDDATDTSYLTLDGDL
jgi:anti-sigma factor RsiW